MQYDTNRQPWLMIQDAGGDVVAMCDLKGSGDANGPIARVARSWQYDAYGECIKANQVVLDSGSYIVQLSL